MNLSEPPPHIATHSPESTVLSESPLLPSHVEGQSTVRAALQRWKTWAGVKAMAFTAALPEREPRAVGVINYHRVHPTAGLPLSVTPEAFRRQLKGLLDRGYTGVTIDQLVAANDADGPLPERWFAVTFDDGFESVLTHALPILRELNTPATVYLTTGLIGADVFPFDPLVYREPGEGPSAAAAADVVRPLSVDGCRELMNSGLIEVGCHTHTHRDFTGDPAAFEADMRTSLDWLRDVLAVDDPTFSYPYGGSDPLMRDVCEKLGLRAALTVDGDLIRDGDDPLHWARFGADEFDSGATLAAKMGGWYVAARKLWRRMAYGERPATTPTSNPQTEARR